MGNGKFEGYLLVADFDDTFCPEHGAPVPEENRRAAQHFMDEGGLFTIATGRDVRSYYSIRDKFTVNAPLVLSNGAVIFDGESGESWYESFLPFSCRSDLLAARDAFPGTGMEVHRGADVRVCGSNATLKKHLSRMGVPVSEADPGHILYPWTKVVLVAPDEIRAESETAHALCAWIAAQFPGRYEAVPSGALVDVVAAGSDKGSGVRRLAEFLDILPENIPLDILYEDDDVLVINKPKGMVVHPANGHTSGTLVNAIMYHCQGNLSGINGVMRPGIVHRIDKDTTGALLVCKNDTAHRDLAQQLKAHTIKRRYRAIVAGNLKEDEGTVEGPIGRHPIDRKKMAINYKNGKDAVTHYKVLERFGNATYIECRLETGRTHQIRVHMTSLGHPLLGDEIYGSGKNPYHLQGQTLHAMVLGFVHPRTGEYMEFSAPLPEYFLNLLEKLRK